MDADWSVELGKDDPVLEIPWASPDGSLRYHALKGHPELIHEIIEARQFPQLREFLLQINLPDSPLGTAKCDAWEEETAPGITPSERSKFGSYVDVVFCEQTSRRSFGLHENFVRRAVKMVAATPDLPATVEFVVRRCYFAAGPAAIESAEGAHVGGAEGGYEGPWETGYYVTIYVFGMGQNGTQAQCSWGNAISHLGRLIVNAGVLALTTI